MLVTLESSSDVLVMVVCFSNLDLQEFALTLDELTAVKITIL